MNDPFAESYFVQDISKVLETGQWRWTARRPELRIYLDDVRGLSLMADLTVPDSGFAHTGPVTISFFVNGNLLDRLRFDKPGQRYFEKPVPEAWLRARWVNSLAMEQDKTWTSPDGIVMGFVLTRAGFAAR